MGQRKNRRVKARKLMGQDRNYLISKAEVEKERKKIKPNQWWKGNHSPPPMGRLMPSQFPSKRLLTLLKPGLFSFCCRGWHYMAWNISSVRLRHLPGCVPSQTLAYALIYSLGGQWETEKALMLFKHCSAIAEILVCCQHCCSHKSKKPRTIQAAVKKINSVPDRLST